MSMDKRTFITICSDRFSDEILLETQGDLPVGELLQDVLKILNWPVEVDGKPIGYTLRTEEKSLKQSDTLISAGVSNFETLWISLNSVAEEVTRFDSPEDKALSISSSHDPYWTKIPVEKPSLINPDGYLFILEKFPALIGRAGGKSPVDVDLSEFEKERFISSRCHAEIIHKDGVYFLHAFQTRNGTFVGREELQTDETRVLNDKDVIQFGVGGVRLIFRKPSSLNL
jgi:hypothetical protein